MITFLLHMFVKLEYHTEEYSSFAKSQHPYVAVFQPSLLYLWTFLVLAHVLNQLSLEMKVVGKSREDGCI